MKAKKLEEIYDCFASEPTVKDLEKYYVNVDKGRKGAPVKRMKRLISSKPDGNYSFLFSGYRGSGKSAELLMLKKELEEDFIVLDFSIQKELGVLDFGHIEFFVVLMKVLLSYVKYDREANLSDDIIKSLTDWVNSKEIININKREIKLGLGPSMGFHMELKADFPSLANFFTKLTATAKASSSLKEILKSSVEPHLFQLIKYCNMVTSEIKMRTRNIGKKKGLVIIVEDMDKLDLAKGEELFYAHSAQLAQLNCPIIYTFPIALKYIISFATLKKAYTEIFDLPMIQVKNKDNSPFPEGREAMKDVVQRRMELSLFEDESILYKMIYYSGGGLVDLFRLIKDAAGNALDFDRETIAEADFKAAYLRMKSDYAVSIPEKSENGAKAYDALAECAINKNFPGQIWEFLSNNIILGYDSNSWYDVHPMVLELLIDRGLISKPYDWLPPGEEVGASGAVVRGGDNGKPYPPISLVSLTLHNIKCYKEIKLSFQEDQKVRPWTLLVGDNGVGKTTILNCIALCALGPELASKIVPQPESYLRVGASEGYMEAVFYESFASMSGTMHTPEEGEKKEKIVIRLNISKGKRIFEVKNDKKSKKRGRAAEFIDARKRTDFDGWFVAGYGAVRNLIFTDEPSKLSPQDPVTDRVESLFDPTKLLIDPNSLYRFLSGDTTPFKEMAAPAKLEQSTTLYIRNLLDKLLPIISLKSPNGSGKLETPFGKVPISELSEGYKSMLSWLSHLIMHLLAAGNWGGDINRIRGIVLIDEVDLHLHPGWQQEVIGLLRESFPNLQFIGCTHSPMTTGSTNDGDMILLELNEGDITVKQDLPSIKGWRADQILTGPHFGLKSSIDRDTQRKMKEYEKLLGITDPSPEEKTRLKELEGYLDVTIPPTGETEMQREAFRLIEETMTEHFKKMDPEKKAQLQEEIKRQLKEL